MPLTNRAPVNAAGQIMVTGTTPTPAWPVLGGMTYEPTTGELAVTSAVPNATDPWVGGLRFTNLGSLYIVTTIPSPVFYVGGLPVSTLGQLFMSANPPVGSVGGWPIAGDGGVAGIGSGIGPVPIFWAPLLTTLVPTVAGNPTFTFTRATTAYVADNDGILRQAIANEARFQGARRVRNLFPKSEAYTTGFTTSGGATVTGLNIVLPTGGTAAYVVAVYAVLPVNTNETCCLTMKVRSNTGGPQKFRLLCGGVLSPDLTATPTDQIFSMSQVDFGQHASGINLASDASPANLIVSWMQAENVSGQSNQAPGDYVSVGVLAAPYHGVGNTVDGIKCFLTTNGNSVPGANLVLWSQDFSNAAWSPGGISLTAGQTAPNGTATAYQVNETTINDRHLFGSTNPVVGLGSNTFTVSIYVKSGTRNFATLALISASGVYASITFDATANTITQTSSLGGNYSAVSGAIRDVGNGWRRVSLTATAGVSGVYLGFSTATAGTPTLGLFGSEVFVGDTAKNIYAWGMQAEVGSSASGYNPTTTAAVPAGNIVTEATGSLIPAATLLGYVAENAATNLCLQSQTFDVVSSGWTTNANTINANDAAAPAPDGTITADRFTDNATSAAHAIGTSLTAVIGTVYTFSLYVKAGTLTWMQLVFQSSSNFWANFNVVTGAVGNKAAGVTSAVQALPNGWYRCSMTVTAGATGCNPYIASLQADTAAFLPAYVGTGQTMYLWGAQVETGSDPSSYVPTTTVAVTRLYDRLTYPLATNASRTVGSAYAEISCFWAVVPSAINVRSLAIGEDAVGNALLGATAGDLPTDISTYDGATSVKKSGLTSMLTGVRNRAVSWSAADSARSITGDGAAVTTGGFSGSFSVTPDVIAIMPFSYAWRGTIRNVKFYATRLTDAEIQTMTA